MTEQKLEPYIQEALDKIYEADRFGLPIEYEFISHPFIYKYLCNEAKLKYKNIYEQMVKAKIIK